jgi:hypothetical protein
LDARLLKLKLDYLDVGADKAPADTGGVGLDSRSHVIPVLAEMDSLVRLVLSLDADMATVQEELPLVTLGLGKNSVAHHEEDTARAFGMETVVDMHPGDTVPHERHNLVHRVFLAMRVAVDGEDIRGSRTMLVPATGGAAAVVGVAVEASEAPLLEAGLRCQRYLELIGDPLWRRLSPSSTPRYWECVTDETSGRGPRDRTKWLYLGRVKHLPSGS